MKPKVLGSGAWGTALARLLCAGKNEVTMWGHDTSHLEDLRKAGRNERYLPGIELPREVKFENELPRAIAGAELIVVAVPSKAFRDVTNWGKEQILSDRPRHKIYKH